MAWRRSKLAATMNENLAYRSGKLAATMEPWADRIFSATPDDLHKLYDKNTMLHKLSTLDPPLVHACTRARVHAYIRALVYACTRAPVHACTRALALVQSRPVWFGPVQSGPGFIFFPVWAVETGPDLIVSGLVWAGIHFCLVQV